MTDLLALTATLVDIPSVSHNEKAVTDYLHGLLAPVPWLEVTRVGENLVARTSLGRDRRLILAGHTDTVPPNGNAHARVEGDVLWGLGAADMKGGVAVLAELARTVTEPAADVTYVFYECEEVDSRFNGVERLFGERPDLLLGDAAVLAEPTGALVEAGCQGTMRVELTMTGTRAHSARSWRGRNAVHRLAPILAALAAHEGRRVVLDGCEFREGLLGVMVEGGVAPNVVPDRAVLMVNHRFAPDRTPEQAEAHIKEVVGEVDEFCVLDVAPAAPPSLGHPLLTSLLAATGQPPRAKLGWTDVARFAARGVPATNYGPGDPNVAHAADERVERHDLDTVYRVLRALLEGDDAASATRPATM
ncbi:MAG TPA: succinyl-diaminopimelate desuccinylase [Acidimicrobiales bacterium]|nr:succinyl-diaminopimelate desuccinylase [Acidimicrobiales bacterium]